LVAQENLKAVLHSNQSHPAGYAVFHSKQSHPAGYAESLTDGF
jgi:hypothetical protein